MTKRKKTISLAFVLYMASVWVAQSSVTTAVLRGYRGGMDATFGKVQVELHRISKRLSR
jgi:hypothetical protein